MKHNLIWSLLTVAAASPKYCSAHDLNETLPVIPTNSGRIHGKFDPALPNVHQYLGIPYAVPPLGQRRWAAPELLHQPHSEVQATRLPPSCLQYLDTHLPNPLFENVLEFNLQGLNKTGSISEDCLTLSIWAPANTTTAPEGVPVLIFIYGGGFGAGGQDVPYQIPALWVDRTPDHIVVSFNYRVGIFGFPNGGGVEDQNLALLDTRAVVKWCRENIAAFGGDPGRMVLWGHSAGSMMADYYGFAYPEDPIVTGLIMNSGTAFTPFFTVNDTSRSNFTFVADHVGCAGLGDDPEQQLTCMRDVDGDVINDFVTSYAETDGFPDLTFVPVEDDTLIFSNYTQRALDGLQADIPAIVGTNALDGLIFAEFKAGNPNGPNATAGLQWDLVLFSCPATNTVRLRQQKGLTAYRYVYYGNFTNVSPAPWMGAYHGAELPILMGTHPNFRGHSSPEEYATSHAFQDAFVAFSSDPENGLEGKEWNSYSVLGSEEVRGFGKDGVAAVDVSIDSTEALCLQ